MSRADVETRWALLQALIAACARPGQPAPLYRALDDALARVCGHRLFTLMVLDRHSGEAERVYSSRPDVYPVAGRKRLADTPWYRRTIAGRRHYLAATDDDIRWAFGDHELIRGLGCGAAINVLVIHDGRVLGSANLLHEQRYYRERDIADCLPFVQLLATVWR